MNIVDEKHLFSFYIPNFGTLLQDGSHAGLIIKDQNFLHRVHDVLRMKEETFCYLFDSQQHALVRLVLLTKKELRFIVHRYAENDILTPRITLFLPILKRAALEDAIYNATEMGVSEIRLITTTKSVHQISHHEYERLEKIIIAAAEQSKQFTLAELLPSLPCEQAINAEIQGKKIWFDKGGMPYFDAISRIRSNQPEHITILIGPEGDFTAQERTHITNAGFDSYSLTPTTLRSVSAVTLAIGMIRTFVHNK